MPSALAAISVSSSPRVALIHCTEKVSAKFPHSLDYVNIVELAEAGEFGNVIIDGPLDVRTACEQASRGHQRNCFAYQRTGGCADFPQYRIGKCVLQVRLPVCQCGYGRIVARTYLPVVLPSRSDSGLSKYYSIAMACLQVAGCECREKLNLNR